MWTTGGGHPHLEGCATCRARYAEFDTWVLGLGDELRAEADEAFPAERLAVQQAQIARRLETLERPARIIAFPKAARAVINGHSHVRRWVTVAAAAGLIAGIGLGQVVPLRQAFQKQQQVGAPAVTLTIPQTVKIADALQPVQTSEDDVELLTDAFARPRVSTLSALDEMTPRSRDFPK